MTTRRIRKPYNEEGPRAVVGIDPSLRGHGIALLVDGKLVDYRGWTDVKKVQSANTNTRARLCYWKAPCDKERKDVHRQFRISMLSSWTATVIGVWQSMIADVYSDASRSIAVAIEGYAFSKRSTGLSDIDELCGVIKTALWGTGIPFRIYDPLSVKLAWTGDGAADKDAMVKAVSRLHGVNLSDYSGAGENMADAILIASLLNTELSVREGYTKLQDLRPALRGVLLRTTKAVPVALVSRPMVHFSEAVGQDPLSSAVGT